MLIGCIYVMSCNSCTCMAIRALTLQKGGYVNIFSSTKYGRCTILLITIETGTEAIWYMAQENGGFIINSKEEQNLNDFREWLSIT